MSSRLSLSLPKPFKSSDDDHIQNPSSSSTSPQEFLPPCSPDDSPSGVKDDLSVLGQAIGRQLRGVASFLAPPSPPHSSAAGDGNELSSSSQTILGIKNDLVEIGGSFKTSISLLSSNKAVTEISRFASNLLQFQDEGDEAEGELDREEEEEDAVGVTEEVLEFVRDISLRPECWTDFPLPLPNDFNMSDIQRDHAETVENLVPTLTALRHNICTDLSHGQFWIIYFILLLPRLDNNDFRLLSTPEIVVVRETLLQYLQDRKNAPVEIPLDSEIVKSSQEGDNANSKQGDSIASLEKEIPVKAANRGTKSDNEDAKQWPDEDVAASNSLDARKQAENIGDVSFSDLEDDDDNEHDISSRLSGFKLTQNNERTSAGESNEWVQLNDNSGGTQSCRQKASSSTSREKDSEGEESSGWLTVDDMDLDGLGGAV